MTPQLAPDVRVAFGMGRTDAHTSNASPDGCHTRDWRCIYSGNRPVAARSPSLGDWAASRGPGA